jgi:hypothetical protein
MVLEEAERPPCETILVTRHCIQKCTVINEPQQVTEPLGNLLSIYKTLLSMFNMHLLARGRLV